MTTQSDINSKNFDFLKKNNPVIENKPASYYAQVIKKMNKISQKQYIMIVAISVAVSMVFYLPHVVSAYKLKSQQEAALNNKIIHQTALSETQQQIILMKMTAAKEQEQAKIQEVQIKEYMKQIKAITPSDMVQITAFIGKVKDMEHKRLNELAWKIRYVHSKDVDKYETGEAFSDIASKHILINDTYNNKLVDLHDIYNSVQQNLTANILAGNEDYELFHSILLWQLYTKLNTLPTLEDIDTLVNDWESEFIDKEGIANYLEKNKALINK